MKIRWGVKRGEILDEPADVLICSANPFLNLSGGVGGSLLVRYGDQMQRWLHEHLRRENRRHVERGALVEAPPCGTPYRAVLHAVAVDAFYETTPEVVRDLVRRSLDRAVRLGAARVALTALATGYGRMAIEDFGEAVLPLLKQEFSPLECVTIVVRKPDEAELLAKLLSAHHA